MMPRARRPPTVSAVNTGIGPWSAGGEEYRASVTAAVIAQQSSTTSSSDDSELPRLLVCCCAAVNHHQRMKVANFFATFYKPGCSISQVADDERSPQTPASFNDRRTAVAANFAALAQTSSPTALVLFLLTNVACVSGKISCTSRHCSRKKERNGRR